MYIWIWTHQKGIKILSNSNKQKRIKNIKRQKYSYIIRNGGCSPERIHFTFFFSQR
jgi:hypothetical protein